MEVKKNKCCIGRYLKGDCHKYNGVFETVDIDDLALTDVELLKVRTKIPDFNEVKSVCMFHKDFFLRIYSTSFKRCTDPLSVHKSIVKTNLHEVTL